MLDPERHPLECQRLVVRLERPGGGRAEHQGEDGSHGHILLPVEVSQGALHGKGAELREPGPAL